MIEKLLGIAKIQSRFKQINHFNSTLPILIEVLKKTKPNHYLLQIGNQTLETKCLKDLEIGSRYYALMTSSNSSKIMLSSLIAEPKYPPETLPSITLEELKDKIKEKKDSMIEQLANAKSKEEFFGLSFFLLGLQKNIFSFWVLNDEKKSFLQIRKKKNFLEFYAIFPHFAEISGKVFLNQNRQTCLELTLQYESLVAFLKQYQSDLHGIEEVYYKVEKQISPLFFVQNQQLLDLKI